MKKLLRLFLNGLGFVLISLAAKAQPCATLQIIGPGSGVIPCDSSLVLEAQITFPSGINNTSTYDVNPIPFNPGPFIGPNPILVAIDDVWSGVVTLPFPFCFYGNTYTQMIVSSNGQIGFDLAQASTGNAWATAGWGPAPVNNVTFNNTIMSPHHDILPTNPGAVVSWGVFGVAPCRTMVVSWTNCSMFSCTSLIDTQQIVLYELTNEIDINIKNKPLCATWNGGIAYEGIQNATGTVANMVPGRNGTQWTVTDDAYRFSPNGPPTPISYTFTWTNATTGAVLGTGPILTLPPPVTIDSVKCQVDVTGGCAPYSFSSTYAVGVSKVLADFSYIKKYGCDEDTVIFSNSTIPSSGTTYVWYFGDLNTSTDPNPTHIYANQGTYTVTLVADRPPCLSDTIVQVIQISHPIQSAFNAVGTVTGIDSVCLGEPILATTASLPIANILGHEWDWGDGTPGDVGFTPIQHTYNAPGVYTIRLIITDTLGCKDTSFQNIFVDSPPFQAFTVSDSIVCVGEPIFFTDTVSTFAQYFEWDFGDGKRIRNLHNPSHSYEKANNYIVTLTGYYRFCPDDSVQKIIIVEDYPSVNLGPDTMICPGVTGAILLANQNSFGSINHLWSTGETSNAISVNQPGRYWLQETSPQAGCTTTDSIWVKRDCYLNIPNSFSPDGDGRNDYFLPRELLASGLTAFTMNIFNRWGELIFTTNSLDGRGWDGKYNGEDQNLGVYVYVINAQFTNGVRKEFTGNVTLIR
jgi:gliding motility-associated-like protein